MPDCAPSGRICSVSWHTASDGPVPCLSVRILSNTMGDPSSGSSPPADFGVDSQSPLSLLTGIRPLHQAPLPKSLPSPAAFVPCLPVAPHAEA